MAIGVLRRFCGNGLRFIFLVCLSLQATCTGAKRNYQREPKDSAMEEVLKQGKKDLLEPITKAVLLIDNVSK